MRDRLANIKFVVTLFLFCFLTLSGCAQRSLSTGEQALALSLHGGTLDPDPVIITKGALVGNITIVRPPRPYKACRERIFPRETEQEIESFIGGWVLDETIHISRKIWSPDYLPDYPDTLPLPQAMFMAHELTHIWQWQNRDVTGYSPFSAASEHSYSEDPYLFELDSARAFLEYPYEQQAALVEEFVCCRALDTDGARTKRLYDLLVEVFPEIRREPVANRVALPWKDAEITGICS